METKADAKNEFQLTLTEEASRKLKDFLKKTGKPNSGLRLRVIPSVLKGFIYEMDFEDKPSVTDVTIESEGIKIFIDRMSFESIKGREIEFFDNVEGSCFRLARPGKK